MYVSVRYNTGGNTNFTLGPGQRHRLNSVDSSDTVCYDTEPFGNACPNATRVALNNSQAC